MNSAARSWTNAGVGLTEAVKSHQGVDHSRGLQAAYVLSVLRRGVLRIQAWSFSNC